MSVTETSSASAGSLFGWKPLHYLSSVALIMLYEVVAFKSIVIPEVTSNRTQQNACGSLKVAGARRTLPEVS